MKLVYFLLLTTAVLASACQKAAEPRDPAPDGPVVFNQPDGPKPITCEDCYQAVINPSCCCVITVLDAPEGRACIELCGTSSPIFPIDFCSDTVFCRLDTQCGRPRGPVREANIVLAPGEQHTYCAAENHFYCVNNCGRENFFVEIRCGRGGVFGPPVVLGIAPNGARYMTVNDRCDAMPCP